MKILNTGGVDTKIKTTGSHLILEQEISGKYDIMVIAKKDVKRFIKLITEEIK